MLRDTQAQRAKAADKDCKLADGGGLYLFVSTTGRRCSLCSRTKLSGLVLSRRQDTDHLTIAVGMGGNGNSSAHIRADM